ncbi:mfs sp sugar h+ symporter [Ophiostoma piceae UAMH 11346]|uniref:Mfs sp sugar h+ symporter n=1 Tax=Ophiostoma piceae (strain UAMH 11346) TaxID=1262450 RepID=S3C4W1_OPHP1|nr:mfs sp sugar h+ symporter [Ophiostoma piceae UAMH 11346]
MATTTIGQFSGVLVMATYGTVTYKTLSYDTEQQLMFQALWLTSGIVPRNRMVGCGIVGCGAMLAILTAIIASSANTTNTAALKAGIALLFMY